MHHAPQLPGVSVLTAVGAAIDFLAGMRSALDFVNRLGVAVSVDSGIPPVSAALPTGRPSDISAAVAAALHGLIAIVLPYR